MALNFPINPTANTKFNAPNGLTYTYDGAKWVVEFSVDFPVATTSALGIIQVGNGLSITTDGVLYTSGSPAPGQG